ncbi:MAG TPA: ribokinase [Microvirga sp.]|nr:ribokinase [Microvirga sp.]
MILVFGSINIDLVFRPPTLPREGETVLSDELEVVPGGKGANQARAAALAQAPEAPPVALVGCVGRDAFADPALALLSEAGVDLSRVRRSGRSTGCAAIVVDADGRNQITVASGANRDAAHDLAGDDLLRPDTLVVLQNEVSPEQNLALARRAAAAGAGVILNAAPARPLDPGAWAGLLRALIVNESEATAIAGAHHPDALASLARRLDAVVIATLGADGAVAIGPGPQQLRVGALALDRVVDTTAAGDSFVGALAAALQESRPLPEALRFASVAGALACTRPGAQTSAPSRAEILSRLDALAPARPF